MDAIEILLLECLLNVFFLFFSRNSNHLTKLLVSLALLYLFRLINKSRLAYLNIKGLLLLFLFNNL
jgi:hypothetical protein